MKDYSKQFPSFEQEDFYFSAAEEKLPIPFRYKFI